MLWIPVTVTAALLQTVRFLLQKRLKDTGLSTGAASYSRFLFAAPFAVIFAWLAWASSGLGWPDTSAMFWVFALGGGVGQILGTLATLALFGERNFAVGMAFTKTETLQVALFSAVVLGEAVSPLALGAILLGVAGILTLSRKPGSASLLSRSAALGIAAGAGFGVSAIGYRGATLALGEGSAFLRAAFTLACVTSFQTIAMGIWLSLRERGAILRVLKAWRVTAVIGLSGMLASLCWFTAFALENATYVRAVGQVEMVFTIAASWIVFRERITPREYLGMVLVLGSILLLVLTLR
ncbi:EamA/RhaT family transporter [Haematobacter massiliensis]|uniref:Membrane protein n=1 Tax=Haematobacter massiliensis TaxID=195105 RepID=A0A086YBW0_9RHOB|nr:DMT family transporter [Haematobacter massiliensis]KFI31760.1 membrane protein [Haematobacter massiliensis]OWJ72144.1 EamA/RhaT family transporter [Haematobacter massiliensis]OWJ87715.1 EamA/RhaT family transporter [Haematobacter massiliensis]QBJ24151.1 DMT family transporter [Haematobacter massiliensis]